MRASLGIAGAALIAGPTAALALTLGEADVQSALGENLDIRIPVARDAGEAIERSCFTLHRDAALVPALTIALERSASGTRLRIRTNAPQAEPALRFRLVVECPGVGVRSEREYAVLLDERRSMAAAVGEAITTLIARIGDTLQSIAEAIFPGNTEAKKSYIEALRAANPPIAALGDDEPIPADTRVALPDLRTFARAGREPEPMAQAPAAPAADPAAPAAPTIDREPATPPVAKPAGEAPPKPERRAPRKARPPAPSAAETAAPAPVRSAREPRGQSQFQLKLSAPDIDLSRTRGIDERMRARLRDRLMVLDADDQVAQLLSLRNSVKQLQSQVADLQLKLSGMPPSLEKAAPKQTPAPQPGAKSEASPAKVEPPAPKSPPPSAAKGAAEVAKPPIEAKPAEIAKPSTDAKPAAEPKPASAKAPEAPKEARPKVEAPKTAAPAEEASGLSDVLWIAIGFVVVLALLAAWRFGRRRSFSSPRVEMPTEEPVEPVLREEPIVVAEEPPPPASAPTEHARPPAPARAEIASDEMLATRLADGDAHELRRRYIEERFPEVEKGVIRLDDADSIVKGARLFYEDGALDRAVELLQFAIERRPMEVKPWLALFEIFRLERLEGQFAELARRFKTQHGEGEHWPKVQFFGREIDPGNPLYQAEPFKSLETIGPRPARAAAAGQSFDPIAENWLNAPMDFDNEVLAVDLRKSLMAQASVTEEDLVPKPMTALRGVEMFSVA